MHGAPVRSRPFPGFCLLPMLVIPWAAGRGYSPTALRRRATNPKAARAEIIMPKAPGKGTGVTNPATEYSSFDWSTDWKKTISTT